MTWIDVVALASELPGVEQSTAYGAPALKVGGKLIACQPANLQTRDGGRVVVLFDVELDERATLVEAEPELFFFNDHFRNYPAVLVRLPDADPERLRPYLERSWRLRAPKRLVRARDAESRGA
jgi:hypothetical protein